METIDKIPVIAGFTAYKQQDAIRLYKYLLNTKETEVPIETLKKEYGGESLRVIPLIIEFDQNNIIEITERNSWGTPMRCKLIFKQES